ncbi:MAG: DoxX family protein [Planctomycetota bacterium]
MTRSITGWILSGLLTALFVLSASGKFLQPEGTAESLEHIGYAAELMPKIGVVEIACVVLFLIPQTSFVGAVLLTGYMGGAIATHVRVGDVFVVQAVVGVLVWVALGLRKPGVFALAFAPSKAAASPSEPGS